MANSKLADVVSSFKEEHAVWLTSDCKSSHRSRDRLGDLAPVLPVTSIASRSGQEPLSHFPCGSCRRRVIPAYLLPWQHLAGKYVDSRQVKVVIRQQDL